MSEKRKKYLHLKNDKNLIGEKLPNKSDLECFEKWKQGTKKDKLLTIIMSSFIIIIVYGALFVTGVFLESELKEKIFGIISLLIFIYFVYYLIKKYINIKFWEMEYCNYGKVVDKYKTPRGDYHDYNIVVEVNDNKLKIKSKREYFSLNVNDDVVVFSIKGHKEVYVTKNIDNLKKEWGNMITRVLLNSLINLIFNSVILFFVFYSILYIIFKIKIKQNKLLKYLLITFTIIISLIISSDSDIRTYRRYTLNYKEISTISFLNKAINDYISNETQNIYSDNIKIISDIPNKNNKRKKITYLNIDDGKYIIPIDTKNKEINTLTKELYSDHKEKTYFITVYKNTMIIKNGKEFITEGPH